MDEQKCLIFYLISGKQNIEITLNFKNRGPK